MNYYSTTDRGRHGEWESKRGWLYFSNEYGRGVSISYEISLNWRYRLCSISIGRGTRSIQTSLYIPWVIGLHLKLGGVLRSGKKREIQISHHGGTIWWHLWCDPFGDEQRLSKLRYGNFGYMDFLLGKPTCHRELLEHKSLAIPMPEKAYWGSVRLVRYSWTRPRWFTKRMLRCEIDVPEGIPHEGKGENSWDCGVDATYGMTTGPVRDIQEGVASLVGSVLRDRVKYGGWGDWYWNKKAV